MLTETIFFLRRSREKLRKISKKRKKENTRQRQMKLLSTMARALLPSGFSSEGGRGGGITAFSSATSLGGSAGGASVQGVGSAVLAASSSAMS